MTASPGSRNPQGSRANGAGISRRAGSLAPSGGKNIGLDHPGQEAQCAHHHWKRERGVTISRIPRIIVPLIMLPNNRTANASVRENLLMILKGNIMTVGSR
jgi:hypothetical protein